MPSAQQPKSISHVVDETTTFRVGMLSVRTSIRCSCNRLRNQTLAGLLLPCCPGLTENAGINGLRQSKPSTFLTPVVKHGAYYTTKLVDHDAPLGIVQFQPMPSHHYWSITANTRILIASHPGLCLKKCLIFGGPLQQVQ